MSNLGLTREIPRLWHVKDQMLGGVANPIIMGILNVTPDSFFDGGKHNTLDDAFEKAKALITDGAFIIDVGGESSRPGAPMVSEEEELSRVIPLISKLKELDVFISIDTIKSKVAEEALLAGAHIVNDISSMKADPKMIDVIIKYDASVVLNHRQGDSLTMQAAPHYESVLTEVKNELIEQAKKLEIAGLNKAKICIDPGIGFGKTLEHNLSLIANVNELVKTGYPVLMGTSRKSFIPKLSGLENSDRLIPSITSNIIARLLGCSIFRVHDVKEMAEAFILQSALEKSCLK